MAGSQGSRKEGFRDQSLVPPDGLEPSTNGLKVHCSAIELEGLGSASLRDAGGVSTMSGITAAARKSTASTPLLHITPLLPSFVQVGLTMRWAVAESWLTRNVHALPSALEPLVDGQAVHLGPFAWLVRG